MTNLNCCHIALIAIVANIITLAIFAGYTVKLRERTLLLEKKNGAEQDQINQLKAKLEKLEQETKQQEEKLSKHEWIITKDHDHEQR